MLGRTILGLLYAPLVLVACQPGAADTDARKRDASPAQARLSDQHNVFVDALEQLRAGDWEQATADAEKAVAADPSRTDAWALLAAL